MKPPDLLRMPTRKVRLPCLRPRPDHRAHEAREPALPTPRGASSLSRPLLLALVAITAAGAALRFYGLDLQSFWLDELFSVFVSLSPDVDGMLAEIRGDGHPPGYQLLLWAVLKLFGNNEIVARIPSAIAGTLSIPAIYLLGRRVYGDREGLVAAAMFAVGWTPVFYGQEARSYSILVLATILSVWGWLNLIRERRLRSLDAATLLLAGLVSAWFHYFGLLVVLLLGAATLFLAIRGRAPWKLLAPFALIGVGWLPCVPNFLYELRNSTKPHIVVLALPLEFLRQIKFYLAGVGRALVAMAVLAVGAAAHFRRFRRGALRNVARGTWFLLAWFAGTMTLVWIQSKVSTPVFTTRNMLIALAPFLLLLARAACTAFERPVVRWVLPVALVALIGAAIPWNGYYTEPHKERWREMVAAVVGAERAAGPGAPLVFGSAFDMKFFTYYFERYGSPQRVEPVPDTPELLERVEAERPDRVWILWGHAVAPLEARAALVGHGYRVAREIDFDLTGAWLLARVDVTAPISAER